MNVEFRLLSVAFACFNVFGIYFFCCCFFVRCVVFCLPTVYRQYRVWLSGGAVMAEHKEKYSFCAGADPPASLKRCLDRLCGFSWALRGFDGKGGSRCISGWRGCLSKRSHIFFRIENDFCPSLRRENSKGLPHPHFTKKNTDSIMYPQREGVRSLENQNSSRK